ncbi:hypothetical protein M9458_042740, partial [Cirrhinus mrigala]
EQVAKLRLEASELRGLLKEENATESKESAESSGESDSHGDLHQTVKVLRSEARNHRKIIRLLKEQLQRNSVSDAGSQIDPKMMAGLASNMEQLQTYHEDLHTSTLEKENKLRERKEMEERYERRRQGQSTKPSKNQKQHMARHA